MKLNRWLIAPLLLLTLACGLPFGASPAATLPPAPATEAPVQAAPALDPTAPALPPLDAPIVEQPQFMSIHMFDALNGWGLTDAAVLRTDDGGAAWRDVTPPAGDFGYIAGSAFLDASHAFIAAPDATDPMHMGVLYRTADGGRTWSMNAIPFGGGSLRFIDPSNGWAMAGLGVGAGSNAIAIFQTTDGGATWTQAFVNDPTAAGAREDIPLGGLKGVFEARDMQTAWVGGIVYSNAAFYLYRSDDGGRSWAQVSAALPPAAQEAQVNIEEMQFPTPRDGFLSLSFTGATGITRALFVTRDGGDNWTMMPTLFPGGRSTDFVSATDGFLFDGARFHVTRDAGATWTIVEPDLVFDEAFMDMDFVDTTTGWVIASDPSTFVIRLYKSVDGGATWELQ